MIDLHTHTILSDGQLDPAEHIRRAEVKGYRMLGMSDHACLATMDSIIPVLLAAARKENELGRMEILAGIELTHVRPEHIPEAVQKARKLGAQVVIVHGETIAEPVLAGTNRAAINAGADILAHPGLISLEEAKAAKASNVLLEISAKPGHSLTNGHVLRIAEQAGAGLIFGSDAHTFEQMPTREYAEKVCLGAGMSRERIEEMFRRAEQLAQHKLMQQEMDEARDW